jgi:hypothetical protein
LIVQRITLAVVAMACLAAAGAIAVFAAAFALYALLRDILTPAGAAGAVCLAAAVLAAIAGLVVAQQAKGPKSRRPNTSSSYRPPADIVDRVVEMARERPLVAAGAAVAAGLLAVANPVLVTAVMRAFVDPARAPRRRRP